MKRWIQTCVAIAALSLAGYVAAQEAVATPTLDTIERFEGVARSDDGKLVYRERHEVHYAGQVPVESVTRYFGPSGTKIAELRSDYRSDPYAPRYVFTGADGRTREAAGRVANGVRLQHLRESKIVARGDSGSARVVLGQGLHQLVRASIAALAAGKQLVVSFGMPARLDFYEFRIQRTATPRPNVVRLEIEINDWFLRMFAPSLQVDYDTTTRRLLSYRGVSNLPGPDGEPQQVSIRYVYPSAAVAPATGVRSDAKEVAEATQ
jgi:hypothetical protein